MEAEKWRDDNKQANRKLQRKMHKSARRREKADRKFENKVMYEAENRQIEESNRAIERKYRW